MILPNLSLSLNLGNFSLWKRAQNIVNRKRSIKSFNNFLRPYGIMAKRLRKIGGKHTSRVHGGQNPISQHLDFLTRIVLKHKIDRFDTGKNYAEGDTSDSESESDDSLELKLSDLKAQASTSQPKNNNYNSFRSQIAEIDSMLATHTYYPCTHI
ncbi:11301_t:CDS:2 [Acaulospora morrowiae]|uniref:11301_t:CDS:1 n=1 Tax=Acaulospora morrowiae TaxID=94023 RepID=A0A9N8ZS54_9GLOM|nr:11301_t:CDS:2 [Acaulospora morrowiae]